MIPKSLHTITALARVAQHVASTRGAPLSNPAECRAYCMEAAAILGYADASDDYGLIDKAAAVIAKGAR